MNIHDMCVTAGFMWEGVKEDDALLAHWGQGCLELCQEVVQYAELSEMLLDAAFTVVEKDFPGVYDYEVSEPFGKWCREHIEGQLINPVIDRERASLVLAAMVLKFFVPHDWPNKQTSINLSTAIEAVRQHWLENHK